MSDKGLKLLDWLCEELLAEFGNTPSGQGDVALVREALNAHGAAARTPYERVGRGVFKEIGRAAMLYCRTVRKVPAMAGFSGWDAEMAGRQGLQFIIEQGTAAVDSLGHEPKGEALAVKAVLRVLVPENDFSFFGRLQFNQFLDDGTPRFCVPPERLNWEKGGPERVHLLRVCQAMFRAVEQVDVTGIDVSCRDEETWLASSTIEIFDVFGMVKEYDALKGVGLIVPDSVLDEVPVTAADLVNAGVGRVATGMAFELVASHLSGNIKIDNLVRDTDDNDEISETEVGRTWETAICVMFDAKEGFGAVLRECGGAPITFEPADYLAGGFVALRVGDAVEVVLSRVSGKYVMSRMRPSERLLSPSSRWPGILPRRRPEKPAAPAGKPDITLDDLAGMDEAVAWGKNLAEDLQAYMAKEVPWSEVDPGMVLHGPPGTGKTTFARALAASCKVPLIATSYAQWQRSGSHCLGDVLEAMSKCFVAARKHKASILFIDELDSLPKRKQDGGRNDSWWTSVVNALLEELDGMASGEGVVVVGACNNLSFIDPAVLRAGRLDRTIAIQLPDYAALKGIVSYHLRGDAALFGDVDRLAVMCQGMTGADVAQTLREARRAARRANRTLAADDVLGVLEGRGVATAPEMLRRIAVHESGHAVAILALEMAEDVSVSLVGGGKEGGVTQTKFRDEAMTRGALERRILVLLAGRAAEQVVLGQVCAGSGGNEESDLAKATVMALDMATRFGFGRRGSLVWRPGMGNPELPWYDTGVEKEVGDMLAEIYQEAVDLIRRHLPQLDAITAKLLERRVLLHTELQVLMAAHEPRALAARKRPH